MPRIHSVEFRIQDCLGSMDKGRPIAIPSNNHLDTTVISNIWISTVSLLGSLSSNVFEQRTSTGSEPFSLLISLDATIFVLLSVLTLIETICPKLWSELWLKSAKSPLPDDVRRSKTSLLKLPIFFRNPRLQPLLLRFHRDWKYL